MIYLFNDVKELTGTVRNNHILNLLYEREKNGIYSVSAEIPVTYNDQGTIYNYNKKIQKSDFLGHYDKEGRFQLHKIAAVDIENGSIFVKGIHIFFDEAKAGAIIKDRRFVNREIIDGARVAFESIGWSVADFDVSVGKTYNFYNVTPLEARQILVETFGFEFDYWLDFDGKKVTNRHVAVKEKIGEKTNKRYTYGHNVLNIRAEQDYSEIYTAVIGRGKGEEIEETGGYGRRIEYTDVVWSKPSKPLNKPAGTRVLEDPNATQLFGYKENGVVKPRVKVEVFSDIESPTELIQASYEWLMDNNVPKAVFSLKVADGDGLNLGDEVYVIYRDIDLIKSARVEKVIDDLVSGNRDVEFGDTAYFDTDRRLSGLRSDLKRYSGETGDRIYRLKMEFNRRFDEEVSSWVTEFEQNLIDQQAQIEADRENMTNLIEGTRTEFTDNLNAEITQTKEYAEEQAQEKANAVRTDLETVTSGHQALIDGLKDNVLDIDTFLGDKSKTLAKQFSEMESGLNQSITAESGRIDAIVTNFGDSGKSLAQFVLDVDSIKTTVAKNDEWLGTYGSAAEQTIAGFEQKVWNTDIANIGANLIPQSMNSWEKGGLWLESGSPAPSTTTMRMVEMKPIKSSTQYTVSDASLFVSAIKNINIFEYSANRTFQKVTTINRGGSTSWQTHWLTTQFRISVQAIDGASVNPSFIEHLDGRIKMKMEEGAKATPMVNAISQIQQQADKLSFKVAELTRLDGEEILTQSDITVFSDRVMIGSQSISSSTMASIISVSPSAIDLISDKINVTGNVNIKGGVTALAIDAIEGNFARLFASQLTANVIKSTHIEASTTLVNKLFASSARIDQLITKTHFVNEMHALTLNVVDLNASHIRSRLLTANTIEASWIKSGTALLDRVFSSTAMFERMMAKSAFVSTLSTITLDLHELTIWRPDGVAVIQNGMQRFGLPVTFVQQVEGGGVGDVSIHPNYWESNARSSRQVGGIYSEHAGRWLNVGVGVGLRADADHASTRMAVVIRPNNIPSGASWPAAHIEEFTVYRGSTHYYNISVPLGRPTFGAASWTLEFYRIGDNNRNPVQLRRRRMWISA